MQERVSCGSLASETLRNRLPCGVVLIHLQGLAGQLRQDDACTFPLCNKAEARQVDRMTRDKLCRKPEHLWPVPVLQQADSDDQLFVSKSGLRQIYRRVSRPAFPVNNACAAFVRDVDEPVLKTFRRA